MGLDPSQRLPLPPYSPYLHKVPEHLIGRCKRDFMGALLVHPHVRTASEMQDLLRHVALNMPQQHIIDDVCTLKLTYKMVATPKGQEFAWGDGKTYVGTGGDWPPHRFR